MKNYLVQSSNVKCPCTDKDTCPNLKYDEKAGGFEYELYECDCGHRLKLYYEDMQ